MMILPYAQTTKNGIILHLKVAANSAKNEICGVINDAAGQQLLKVKVTAIADSGKANSELIKFIAKEWRISRTDIEIISGATASRKKILIKDMKVPLPSFI